MLSPQERPFPGPLLPGQALDPGAALWGFQSRTQRQGTSQLTTTCPPWPRPHPHLLGAECVLSQLSAPGVQLFVQPGCRLAGAEREKAEPVAPPPTPHKGSATTRAAATTFWPPSWVACSSPCPA